MLKKTDGAALEMPVEAVRVTTGVGKTRIMVETIAEDRRARRAAGETGPHVGRPWLYLVPTHRLGDEIVELFAKYGLTAKVFRGRSAVMLGKPNETMCQNLDQVKMALVCGEAVSESCCKSKERKCLLYATCAYQQQTQGPRPDVWICAHEMLFHGHKALGEIVGVVVDESFWQDGIRIGQWDILVDAIGNSVIPPAGKEDDGGDLDWLRNKLAKALGQQEAGGVRRKHIVEHLTRDQCTQAVALEWKLAPRSQIYPGMPQTALKDIENRIEAIRFARHMITIWGAARELIDHPEIEVSGRLYLEKVKDESVVKWRGIAPVREQYKMPTMLMDATLPDLSILRPYYPNVALVADLEEEMPHVIVRQLLNAPVSATRLIKTSSGVNRNAIRRYILKRWIESGRQPTLVICQEKVETWLKGSGLPDNITVEHFNNVGGLDRYKDVRLLITVGRTVPGPEAVEAMAAALTGMEPVKATSTPMNPQRWYKPVVRGIRQADGNGGYAGIAVQCDQHPDPTCEAIRFAVCEAELLQAIGRGRGVNRTKKTPLDIDILANVCLPLTVNEVSLWQEPSAIIEALVDGVFVVSPADMVRCWPHLWESERAARWTLDRTKLCVRSSDASPLRGSSDASPLENTIKDLRQLMYRLTGQGMQVRHGFFDPKIIPDPKAWLEERLGPLAHFEVEKGLKGRLTGWWRGVQ